MIDFTVKDAAEAAGGTLLFGDPKTVLRRLSTDSRAIPADCLFVPIKGERTDGHDYIEGAVKNGAAAVLTHQEEAFRVFRKNHPESSTAFILVENTTEGIQKIGKAARLRLKSPAVGVTGSVGKTTTREMIAAALSAEKKVFKTDKNYNNWLGVPLTLSEISEEDDISVLELGLNVRGELGLISSLCALETAVITNIGVAHIEYYGTRDEICKEKLTITKGFSQGDPKDKLLILNADDPYLMKYKDTAGFPYVTYGMAPEADYRAENVRLLSGHYRFDLWIRGEKKFEAGLSVLGKHNVLNALAAFAVADRYGVDLQKAAESLYRYTGFKRRLECIEHAGFLIIDDTYNASPDSMKAGLNVLREIDPGDGSGRKFAVLGDMLELGENSRKYHYDVGVYAAGVKPDGVFLFGENAREIMRGILDNAPETAVYHFEEKAALISALKQQVKAHDVVFIKASNGMALNQVTEGLMQ